MVNTAWVMALAVGIAKEINQGGGMYVDLLNLQWWQAVGAIIAALGLSPAPWLLGLAANRIQFTNVARKDFERQIAEMTAAHARELTARDAYHQGLMTGQLQRYSDLERSNASNIAAAERERARADEVTDAALELGEILQANTHVMASLHEAAEIVEAEQKP